MNLKDVQRVLKAKILVGEEFMGGKDEFKGCTKGFKG